MRKVSTQEKKIEMTIKKLGMLFLGLLMSACATVTQDQALRTVKSKYSNGLFVYVDAPSNAISSGIMAATLKVSSSTTSDALVQALRVSDKTIATVAGKSDVVTAATIRRAIEDAGNVLPKNGRLVIVGEPKEFEEIANFARSRGLSVDVMPPAQKDGSSSQIQKPMSIAPSTDPAIRLQNQVQNDSNIQMDKVLQGSGVRK